MKDRIDCYIDSRIKSNKQHGFQTRTPISDSLYLARYFTGEAASSQSDEAVRVLRSTQTQRSYFAPFRLPSYL